MKKLFTSVFITMLSLGVFAQITLEETYTNTELEAITTSKGVKYYNGDSIAVIYNEDHTVFKTIDLKQHLPNKAYDFKKNVYFSISETDLNGDTKLEIIYTARHQNETTFIIIDENSTLIFKETFQVNSIEWDIQGSENKKLILTTFTYNNSAPYTTTNSYVYDVKGTPNAIAPTSNKQSSTSLKAYPNPSTTQMTISYKLPASSSFGEMKIYDTKGQLKESFSLGKDFNTIKLNTTNYASGLYLCKIYANGTLTSTEKLMIKK